MDRTAPQSSPFQLELVPNGRVTHLRLSGELDMASAPLVIDQLKSFSASDQIVVDLRGLTFMDSTGLSALLSLAGGEPTCRFIAGRENVQRVIEITGTTDRFDWVTLELP